MTLRGFGLALGIAFSSAAACSVYDDSLLAPTASGSGVGGATTADSVSATSGSMISVGTSSNGGATTGGSSASGASTASSGSGGCTTPTSCPGSDTECMSRTCDMGVCGVDDKADGAMLVAQTAGDCKIAECDGKGAVKSVVDDTDIPNDMLDCTTDACAGGVASNTKEAVGTACTQNGGAHCDPNGLCVECTAGTDCPSMVCDPVAEKCVAASCMDKVQNGTETDVDCGGGGCPGCATGDACVGDGDCLGMVCVGKVCQPSCADGMKDNGETDIDCGGPACNPCAYGDKCSAGADCVTGSCSGGVCVCGGTHLVISEIKTRGVNGGTDEFVEIYNPTPNPVVLDSSWGLQAKSYNGANYVVKWAGQGKTLPSDKHYLTVGSGYTMAPAFDDSTLGGISDAASVTLTHSGATIDAVCFQYNTTTLTALESMVSFTCEGTPTSNLPHNDTTNGASNTDVSIERKPGGAAGNCVDTNDNSKDFQNITPPDPQGLAAPATP